jgi:hypothetical protein
MWHYTFDEEKQSVDEVANTENHVLLLEEQYLLRFTRKSYGVVCATIFLRGA